MSLWMEIEKAVSFLSNLVTIVTAIIAFVRWIRK